MEDRYIHQLFSPFSRDVGNPSRIHIAEYSQFVDFVKRTNGKADCFCELYPAPYTTIDKIFFDFDGPSAYSDAKLFYKYLMIDRQIPTIPIASGKKGVHLHALTKPHKFETVVIAKNSLWSAAVSLLLDFSKKPLASVDTHVIGDVRRFCRIPNTLRPPENSSWCTYLPSDFMYMRETDIISHVKSPHNYEYQLPPRHFQFSDIVPQHIMEYTVNDTQQVQIVSLTPPDQKILTFLSRVMRPCLFKAITQSNPRHHTRVAATVDLKGAGFTLEEVIGFYSQLHWVDFDSELTRYQVGQIFRSDYIPYSCRTLQSLGICNGDH